MVSFYTSYFALRLDIVTSIFCEIELINLSTELKLQLTDCDVVSNNSKIRKYIKKTGDKLKKEDIFIYNDLFIKEYIDLISLNEKKYIPNPIYVKTF